MRPRRELAEARLFVQDPPRDRLDALDDAGRFGVGRFGAAGALLVVAAVAASRTIGARL